MNGLTLAYIGDSYYEYIVRKHLVIDVKLTKVDDLHKRAIRYTSSVAQKKIMNYFIDANLLTQSEVDLYKRGRNVSGPKRRNVDAQTYHMATGFESLIGGIYFENKERCDELIRYAIDYIEKGVSDGESS